jgi:hypothetical protein
VYIYLHGNGLIVGVDIAHCMYEAAKKGGVFIIIKNPCTHKFIV